MKTSASRARSRTIAAPSGVRMSTASDCLPALSAAKPAGVSPHAGPSPRVRLARITSPAPGGSTFTTVAPNCAR